MNSIFLPIRLFAILGIVLCLFARTPGAAAIEGESGDRAAPAASNGISRSPRPENHAAMSKPMRKDANEAPLPASFASSKINRLPDGNVEFCAGPGHE